MFGKKTKELLKELESKNSEIVSLKARIDELEKETERLKEQEASVARAIKEAGDAARRIESEAEVKRGELLADAEKVVALAHENADAAVKTAEEEAEEIKKKAEEYCNIQRKEAENYAENTRTDVNIYVERTIVASQLEVKKRKDVSIKLNELLKETVKYLTEKNNEYAELLNSVADEKADEVKELCRDVEKCSCSCKDCENDCSIKENAEDSAPDTIKESETDREDAPAVDLPEEYENPAQLMQNIYHILNRQLPEQSVEEAPVPEEEPEKSDEKVTSPEPETQDNETVESSLPHDESLADLVSDIVK